MATSGGNEVRISVGHASDYLPVTVALRTIAEATPAFTPEGYEQALARLRGASWSILEYKRDWPDPEKVPTGDQTLEDLHGLCLDVVRKRGGGELMKLFDTYGIASLNELPVNRFVEFYHDAFTTYHSIASGVPA